MTLRRRLFVASLAVVLTVAGGVPAAAAGGTTWTGGGPALTSTQVVAVGGLGLLLFATACAAAIQSLRHESREDDADAPE